ncbi:MAG TPA: hypothetical protein VLL52_02615 [Anaerolineae bacterium]|nr:hypothetical protein [Anaerolineae bacterium]
MRHLSLLFTLTLLLLAACSGQADLQPTDTPPQPATQPAPTTAPPTAVPTLPGPVVNTGDSNTNTDTPTSPTAVPTTARPPLRDGAHFYSPEYGIQAFLWWRPDIAQRDVALVEEMGFGWIKQSFSWRDIETLEKGSYDWYRPDLIVDMVNDAGLNLLVRIDRQPFWSQPEGTQPAENQPPEDLTDFADFCRVLAERYRGRIQAYQVWNEPNLSREWGGQVPNPAEYTQLLKVCYEAIKSVDPEAIIISAGLAPTGTQPPIAMPDTDFLQGMYDAGAANYFDVLGLNAPGYKAPPETSPEEAANTPEYGSAPWFVFRHVETMRDIMVQNGDADKQVAILEMGWTLDNVNPDYAWFAVDEATQAEYLARAYKYAYENWTPWIGLMSAIYIADYDWTAETHEQYWWSVVLPDGTPRQAYYSLQEMPKPSVAP